MKKLKETNNYVLTIVTNGEEKRYGIVNKDTGVIEFKADILAQALKVLPEIQKALDEVEKES